MTARDAQLMQLLDRVDLTPLDRAFIAGAVAERRAAATARGQIYGWSEFMRDALIEAAHR